MHKCTGQELLKVGSGGGSPGEYGGGVQEAGEERNGSRSSKRAGSPREQLNANFSYLLK